MAERSKRSDMRETLIRAGIKELNLYGISDFSIRRIASACGVSCAAPYKHFQDRKDFIAAIINYVNDRWYDRQKEIMLKYEGDVRHQLVELSVNYVKFLVENPHFRSILMFKDNAFDSSHSQMKGQMSKLTQMLVRQYCEEVNMDDATRERKLYVVRALIYGAALMFDNGEMKYNEETLNMVRQCIDREFDLP